jgi:YHS domain-containing protein
MFGRLVLIIVMFALSVPALFAHEDHSLVEDVVCGMKFAPAEAAGSAGYQGQTYYFCSQPDLNTFKNNPEKYASELVQTRDVGGREYRFAVKPRQPKAGDEITLTFTLPKGALPPTKEAPSLEVLFYDLTLTREEVGRSYFRLPPGAANTYTMGRYYAQPGIVRLVLLLPGEGEGRKIPFGFTVAGVPTTAPALEAARRPEPKALTMEAQHETMRVIGREWVKLKEMHKLSTPTWDDARNIVYELITMSNRLPGFALHKFPASKPEFTELGRELTRQLDEYLDLLVRQERDLLVKKEQEIEGQSCTKCHLKFRWGIVADLSRFPDLREYPTKGAR